MKKYLFVILVMVMMGTVGHCSEMTIKIREVIEETKSEEVKTDIKYFADIYIDGKEKIESIVLNNTDEAKVVCEAYMKEYNRVSDTQLPTTVKNIDIEKVKVVK